jgi:hypothetical protein
MTGRQKEILALCVEIRSMMTRMSDELDAMIAMAREMNRDKAGRLP